MFASGVERTWNALNSIMGRLICIALVLSICSICIAQESIPSRPGEIESFALQIVNTPAQQRTELLAAHPKLMTAGLRRELVRRGNILLIDGKYAPAFDLYQLAHKVAEQISDKEGLAATALNIGSVYYFQGNYELAAEHYRKAQGLFASLANRLEAAKALYGLALTYQAQRKLAESLKAFEQALREFETLNDRNEIVNTLAEIGSIQYDQGNYEAATKTFLRISSLHENAENLVRIADAFYRQHDYTQALVYYQKSLEHFGRKNNAAGVIAALNGAAHCYYYQGDYDQAFPLYSRSLTIAESLKDQSGVATQLQNIGNIHRVRGDYGAALQSYFNSLSAAATAPTQSTVATTLGSIGLVRALQADNAQAIEYFDKSLKAFETNGDQVGMARMLSQIGNVRYIQGLHDLALEAYERSLALHRARSDHLNQAHLLLAIGTVYLGQLNYPSALEKYHESLKIYESLGRMADITDALTKLAAAHRQQNQHEKGLEFANRAVSLAKDKNLHSALWIALTEAGRLQQGLNRSSEALSAFMEAIRIHTATRTEFGAADAETATSSVMPYLGAVEVLIDQNDAVTALVQSENAKSQVLREIISRGNFRITKGMTPAEQKEESRLLGDVASLKLQLKNIQERDGSDTAVIAALNNRLAAARAAGQSFRKQLYRRHPQLAVYRGEVAPVKIEQLRSLLGADMAILEYAVTPARVVLFVVTRNPTLVVKAYPLAIKPAEIAQLTARYLRLSANRDQSTTEVARALYDILLKPAQPQTATKSRLLIIPDGVVWDVPFAALQPSENQYLADQQTVSHAISISTLKEMRRSVRGAARGVLAFGNTTLSDELADRLKTTYKDLELSKTPPSSDEITKLQTIWTRTRSRFYAGAATKEQAKTDASNYSLIHFATPTILDQSVPLYSFVVLSPDPKVPDEGLLRLWEVLNLNSKANIVVLPSAGFAQTESRAANALIAMSWAWFVAGTPTVMLSRWNVEAPIVLEFSSELHRKLRSHANKSGPNSNAEALRQSALKLRRSPGHENPHDWSGFMLIGVP